LWRCLCQSTGKSWEQTHSSENATSSGDSEGEEEFTDKKEKILEAALLFVPRHGWSTAAIAAGAEEVGLSVGATGMFPSGGFDLADYFYKRCNKNLITHLEEQVTITEGKVQRSQPLGQFMESTLEVRLRMIVPYLDRWPQAMGLMSLPYNAPTSIRNLQTLVDDIWYYSGDTSTDFNWYTKRAMLAGVYKVTELCLIQDRSPDYTDTWAFLHRRLSDLTSFSKGVRQVQEVKSFGKDLVSAMFITGSSILGLGNTNR